MVPHAREGRWREAHRRGMAGTPCVPCSCFICADGRCRNAVWFVIIHPAFLSDGAVGRIKTEEEDGRTRALRCRGAALHRRTGRGDDLTASALPPGRPAWGRLVGSLGRSAGRCGGGGTVPTCLHLIGALIEGAIISVGSDAVAAGRTQQGRTCAFGLGSRRAAGHRRFGRSLVGGSGGGRA